jgi:hypothetical protein
MAARFSKPQGGKTIPPIAKVTPAYLESQIGVSNMPKTKIGALDKGSAAIWNVLSALGTGLKSDAVKLKNNPLGEINRFLDSMTIGDEARNRFRQGDYTGSIIHSGLGSLVVGFNLRYWWYG